MNRLLVAGLSAVPRNTERGAHSYRKAALKWYLRVDALNDAFGREQDINDHLALRIEQLEDKNLELSGALGQQHARSEALAVQLFQALSDGKAWKDETADLRRRLDVAHANIAAYQADVARRTLDITSTVHELHDVTEAELADLERRWQRSEDARVAAELAVETLEGLCVQESNASERLQACFHRGMRIMQSRLDRLEGDLTLAEESLERSENELYAIQNSPPPAMTNDLAERLAGPQQEPRFCIVDRLNCESCVDAKNPGNAEPCLSCQPCRHEPRDRGSNWRAPPVSREETQEMQCQQCGKERGITESFANAWTKTHEPRDERLGDRWLCLDCYNALPETTIEFRERNARLAAHGGSSCETCADFPTSSHEEPCLTCRVQESGFGTNWHGPAPLPSLHEEIPHLTERMPNSCYDAFGVRKICDDCTVKDDGNVEQCVGCSGPTGPRPNFIPRQTRPSLGSEPARVVTRDEAIANATAYMQAHAMGKEVGDAFDRQPPAESVREPLLDAIDEETEHTEFQFSPLEAELEFAEGLAQLDEPTQRTCAACHFFPLPEYQAGCVDLRKNLAGPLDGSCPQWIPLRLTPRAKEQTTDQPGRRCGTCTHFRRSEHNCDGCHPEAGGSATLPNWKPIDLSLLVASPIPEQADSARALNDYSRTDLLLRGRKRPKNEPISAPENAIVSGRACGKESEPQANKPVTGHPSETGCQNMANRLASSVPERGTSSLATRVLDKISQAIGLTPSEDLALRVLVKRPSRTPLFDVCRNGHPGSPPIAGCDCGTCQAERQV